jgi:hypothetical protein
MIKLFNQTFISRKRKWIGSLVTGGLVVAALLLLGPAAANNDRPDNGQGHMLHLIPHFNPPVTTQGFAIPLPVGAQATIGGTVSDPSRPDEPIGTIGLQFVATLSGPTWDELLGNACIVLPDGKISYQNIIHRPVAPDSEGNINRISAITGGTGAYRNARGEINDVTHANGFRELVLSFNH